MVEGSVVGFFVLDRGNHRECPESGLLAASLARVLLRGRRSRGSPSRSSLLPWRTSSGQRPMTRCRQRTCSSWPSACCTAGRTTSGSAGPRPTGPHPPGSRGRPPRRRQSAGWASIRSQRASQLALLQVVEQVEVEPAHDLVVGASDLPRELVLPASVRGNDSTHRGGAQSAGHAHEQRFDSATLASTCSTCVPQPL
jgi:hypothetical protein